MKKKYRILFTSMSGEMVGGGQKSLFLLLERLDTEKYKPFLICPNHGNLITKVERLGIETALIPTTSLKNPNIFSQVSIFRKFLRFIKSNSIDLIHTDAPRQTFYAGLAAKKTKTPLVWHVRVSDPEKRLYDKTLASLSSRMIAVSLAVRQRLERAVSDKEKIVTIYNGINLKDYGHKDEQGRLERELGKEEDCVFVGTASQLIPRKGFGILLRAASQVLKTEPRVKFVLIGDGNETYRKELQTLSKERCLESSVLFMGYREDIPQIMSFLDIVVLPSIHAEGLSRLILEGMASSKPVIASDIGGNSEAVEDGKTGFIIPPGDVDSLAQTILKLVQDKRLRQKMGAAGRQRAGKQFSIEQNVNQIESVYEDLLCG